MKNETQVQLDILYDGPALRDGSMNVRDLAPSMLGIGALFESANQVLNGERASVNVNVRATSSGSFHILYEVIQSQGATLTLQDVLTTAVSMKELIFGGAIALFTIVKLLRGKSPKIEKINDNLFRLTIGKETYEVPLEWVRLYQDINTRRALSDVVRPVKTAGIERFEIREKRHLLQYVTKQEVEAFDVPEVKEHLLDEVNRRAFSVVSLSFKEDYKWRLTDGQAVYSVSMKDEAFQKRVDKNEIAFAKGDVLLCDLHTIQWQVEDGVKTEYEVIKVVSHMPARQLRLIDWENQVE
ncbi:MAG: hypothetical protein FJ015_01610 [Chloroflexi bacterium]|nr:hypothetical protein [Chloroflexota bacterium]